MSIFYQGRHPHIYRALFMLALTGLLGLAAFWLFASIPWSQPGVIWKTFWVIAITYALFIAVGSSHPWLDGPSAAVILFIPAMVISLLLLLGLGLALVGLQLLGLAVLALVMVGSLLAVLPSGWQDWLFDKPVAQA